MQSTATDPADTVPGPRTMTEPATFELRPRFEGSNIATWIGFKHVNYLVEEAVLEWLRRAGLPPGSTYERHGLGVDLVDLDTRIRHGVHLDEAVEATVSPRTDGTADCLLLDVVLSNGPKRTVRAVSAQVGLQWRRDTHRAVTEPVPHAVAPYTVETIGCGAATAPVPVGEQALAWRERVPYYYCHFSTRLQMSGYLRLLEDAVDRFLADRGISVASLLAEREWIPVVPRSRVVVLGEALMEEQLTTAFTVESVFKNLTFTARMDCFVTRDGVPVRTATATITHGYAQIEGPGAWNLVEFDDRVVAALTSTSGRQP